MSADKYSNLFVAVLTMLISSSSSHSDRYAIAKQLPTRLDSLSRYSCAHLRTLMCRSSCFTHTPKRKAHTRSHLNLAFCVYVMRKNSISISSYPKHFSFGEEKRICFFLNWNELNVNWNNIFAFRRL